MAVLARKHQLVLVIALLGLDFLQHLPSLLVRAVDHGGCDVADRYR